MGSSAALALAMAAAVLQVLRTHFDLKEEQKSVHE